ncbi:MAG: 50S ribosomal protein L11 methyltransferase [Gammaproteobacteria bacterium]
MQQLTIETTEERAEVVSDALMALGAVSVTFQDAADQPLFEPAPETTPLWDSVRVIGLFDADCKLQLTAVEDKVWEREWIKHFHPMQFGKRVWICPSWCEPPDPHAVNILLDPGLAFGTGTHPTTSLCLNWLDAHPPIGQVVMDYGCGSGILAIAAMKLGAKRVIGIDHDPQALTATQDNAKKNSVIVEMGLPPIAVAEAGEGAERVGILLANILAQPLLDLASLFATLVCPGGKIVLSGILEHQVDVIKARYQPWFDFNSLQTLEGWACLSGTRKQE